MKARGVKPKITAIVPSAGKGLRFRSKKKPFTRLDGKPLLLYALRILQSSPLIGDIVLVVDGSFRKIAERLVKHYRITKIKHIVGGGRTRSDSVKKGLRCVDKDVPFVLIHDGVRPFLNKDVIKRTVAAAKRFGASISAVPVKATIKVSRKGDLVKYTPDRRHLWEVQTPQVFKRNLIEKAYKKSNRRLFTDDASLIEYIDARVKIVRGEYDNIKITTKEDIKIAEVLLKKR